MLTKLFKKMMGIDKLEQKLIDTQAEIEAARKIAEQKVIEAVEADKAAEKAKEY